MADPYALLAATDERTSNAFEAINRNAIAAFNAESEAAKFGFQANMQVAQFREMQAQNSFERDIATQKLTLEEKLGNQRISLAKIAGARQLAEADREFNYRIAGEARQNLDSQLKALGTEEEQWRAAALSGDSEAGDKIKEIQEKKHQLGGQMADVFNKIKQEIDAGNSLNIGKSLRDLDDMLNGREPQRAEPPDSMTQSIGRVGENGFVGEEEDLPEIDGQGVLPRHPGNVGPNTLTGSAPTTSEPSANAVIATATAKNTAQARDLFPAALQSATQKAVDYFKGWLGGQTPDTKKEPAKITSEIGATLSRTPRAVPEGGVVSLNRKEYDHFRNLIGTDYASVPENLRPSLLTGKRRAYSSLLQAGDPVVKSQYETLYRLGTSPDITQADANGQLEDAVKEGMISDHTRREWLLQKSGNIERKTKAQDPFKQDRDNISAMLDLATKAKSLRTTGTPENPQTPIDVGDKFIDQAVSSAQATMANMQLDMTQRSLMERLDHARSGPQTDPNQVAALQVELQETHLARGRQFAGQRIPVLNSQMKAEGLLGDGESAIALAKNGEANFINVISSRIRSHGVDEATARTAASVYYKQYAAMTPFITDERAENGMILSAPKPIELQVGPSSAVRDGVVDTTIGGQIREIFSGDPKEKDMLTQSKRATTFLKGINQVDSGLAGEVASFYDGASSSDMTQTAGLIRNWEPNDTNPKFEEARSIATKLADRETQRVFGGGGYGQRPDGSEKGKGWLGELKLPDGGVATEYTMQSKAVQKGGKQIDFPTLVPTLSKEEVDLMVNDIIPNRKDIPEPIIQKAIQHANSQISKGRSVFADSGQTSRKPNKAEIDSLKNDIEALGISGRFNLNDRTDFHNALKRVIGVKLARGFRPNQ